MNDNNNNNNNNNGGSLWRHGRRDPAVIIFDNNNNEEDNGVILSGGCIVLPLFCHPPLFSQAAACPPSMRNGWLLFARPAALFVIAHRPVIIDNKTNLRYPSLDGPTTADGAADDEAVAE
jgi:hypothetical protein